MKTIFTFLLLTAPLLWGQRTTSDDLAQAASEVSLQPSAGRLFSGQLLRVSFPAPMAEAKVIDVTGQACPIFSDPPLELAFFWKSPREGEITVKGPVKPGQTYALSLQPGLVDLQQRPVTASWSSLAFATEPFTAKSEFRVAGDALAAEPEVPVEFSYPVKVTDLLESAYFQDRDSGERASVDVVMMPVEVRDPNQKVAEPAEISQCYVRPRRPLPVHRTFDLVIEGVKDAGTGTAMPGLKVIPLGNTRPLTITEVVASAPALSKPYVRLSASAPADAETVTKDSVKIEPAVENLKFVIDTAAIQIEADFQITQTYQVTLAPTIKAKTGFGLEGPVSKTAVFEGLNATIDFPQGQFYQRSALGLNVTAMQSNCGEATWRLAKVPLARLRVVEKRLKEYQDYRVDPLTGEETDENVKTELLVDALGLEVVASGAIPGVGQQEALFRPIQWKPANGAVASGAYLLEAHARTAKGSVVGNRSLLFFNEVVITRKYTPTQGVIRVASMESGAPIANAAVEIITEQNDKLVAGATDAAGQFRFTRKDAKRDKQKGAYVLVKSDAGGGIQPLYGMRFGNSSWVGEEEDDEQSTHPADAKPGADALATLVTDRTLYRPGHTVKFKGFARMEKVEGAKRALSLPEGKKIKWVVTQGHDGPEVGAGEAALDEFGGWEGEWKVPESGKLGAHTISYRFDGDEEALGHHGVQIEEYRVPLFSVEVEAVPTTDGNAGFRVRSNYFHGGPNANARLTWTADWSSDVFDGESEFTEDDQHSPDHREPPRSETASGEARLDGQGMAIISVKNPYQKPYLKGRFHVSFQAEVISPEGRTETAGGGAEVFAATHIAGVKMRRVEDDTPPELAKSKDKKSPHLEIELRAVGQEKKPVADLPMSLEVFFVETQTVKEKLGPAVFRYRNFPVYHSLEKLETKSGAKHSVPAEKSGHYVAVAKLTGVPEAPIVSADAQSNGEGEGYYDVYNDAQITLRADKTSYLAGADTARIALESPIGGQAWVTLETDDILDQTLVTIPDNSQSISIPIKPEYHPNVTATVYLLKPGGPDHLPMERYGRLELRVKRPDLELKVEPKMSSPSFEPGSTVTGATLITAGGQPLADADVTLFAVDEAILRLGMWEMPTLVNAFYPDREFRVATYRALLNHYEKFDETDVVEKGFVIGGGMAAPMALGDGAIMPSVRKDFVPLAFWKTGLRTDAQGQVKFEFKAPDNLTSFRVVALAQTKTSQFGAGSANFAVAKKFMIEPALPRFARRGDTLELRAVVRQSYLDSANAVVRCIPGEGLEMLTAAREVNVTLTKNAPAVVRFPVKVLDLQPVKIRFEGGVPTDPSVSDVVELTVPVRLPGITQKTGHFGRIVDTAKPFDLSGAVPDLWKQTEGTFRLTLSRSPYLPEIQSLPEVLDYPHGCFEQKSSRLLGYGAMAQMLDYLPELKSRHANYSERLRQGLVEFEQNLTPEGMLPYWPGQRSGNPWVTCMAYWVMELAKKHGVEIPQALDAKLPAAVDAIIAGQAPNADLGTQAFALFVRAEAGAPNQYQAALTNLHARRNQLGEEPLALTLLAMQRFGGMEADARRLMARLTTVEEKNDGGFRPATFGSYWRNWALETLARARGTDNAGELAKLRQAFLNPTGKDENYLFSTQENFWKLMVLKEFMNRDDGGKIDGGKLNPQPDFVSANGVSVAWKELGLEKLREWSIELEAQGSAYFLADANVLRADEASQQREDRGFRIERVIQNLTKPERKGTPDAPFQIGDELLLTYRFESTRNHYYVALTDELPSGIETVNFNLPQVAQFYQLPAGASSDLELDYSELRDQSANLYFNYAPAGNHQYSILARVTAAGEFVWPSTQIAPMYQAYFSGLGASAKVFSRHDG